MALLVGTRGTCPRRQVGCVLVDQYGRTLATGYNGAARGQPHCSDENPCPGRWAERGTGFDLCHALHAEQNALMFCRDVMEIETAYVTDAPCATCCKMLLNTSCWRIVFVRDYPTGNVAETLWCRAGREWLKWSGQESSHDKENGPAAAGVLDAAQRLGGTD